MATFNYDDFVKNPNAFRSDVLALAIRNYMRPAGILMGQIKQNPTAHDNVQKDTRVKELKAIIHSIQFVLAQRFAFDKERVYNEKLQNAIKNAQAFGTLGGELSQNYVRLLEEQRDIFLQTSKK